MHSPGAHHPAEDQSLIAALIDELKASNVCISRANKLTFILIVWRRYIGLYSLNAIPHLYTGLSVLR